MINYIIKRLLQTLIILLILSFFCFFILHLIPGDPALAILGDTEATAEELQNLREELGLDKPFIVQYFSWLLGVLSGDLGTSYIYNESVLSLLLSRIPPTLHIGIIAFIISVVIGVPLGVIAAVKRGGWIDATVSNTANFGMAIPNFWFAILGIYLFSLQLGWLPVQGYVSPREDFWASIQYVIMPSLVLGLSSMAMLARQARSSMLEVIGQDYIRTAYSKGMKRSTVIRKHALKNAIIPVITLVGIMIPNIVGGSVVVEQVFNINGLGRLMLQAVFDQDVPVVQGGIILIAITVAFANLMVDLSYGYFDPRTREK